MIRTLWCVSCGVSFQHEYVKGSPPQRCPDCRVLHKKVMDREKSKRWREADPQRAKDMYNKHNRIQLAKPEVRQKKREQHVLRKYGLTPEQLQAMLDEATSCTICGGPPAGMGDRFHIDHCHRTKKVRGLLCGRCNTLLGLAHDNPERLEAAAAYLRRHQL